MYFAYFQCIILNCEMYDDFMFLHRTLFGDFGAASFTVSTELLSRGEGLGAVQGEDCTVSSGLPGYDSAFRKCKSSNHC